MRRDFVRDLRDTDALGATRHQPAIQDLGGGGSLFFQLCTKSYERGPQRRAAGASAAGVTGTAGTEVAAQNWQCEVSTLGRSSADESSDVDDISSIAEGRGWAAWAMAWTVPQTTRNTAMKAAIHTRKARVPGILLRTGFAISS